jgi:tetratricopeptide (TPR) repeat protein
MGWNTRVEDAKSPVDAASVEDATSAVDAASAVDEASAVNHRSAPSAGGFVGRSDQVAELRRLLTRAEAGHGAVVVVRGEAGVGKTRLVGHALTAPTVLWGRCRETGAPALWPWTQIARNARHVGILGLDALTSPSIADASPTVTSSGHDRFARFDQMAQSLVAAGRTQPVVLVLDDLQWADDDSIELLSFAAADAAHGHLLVVATVRVGESFSSARLAELIQSTNDVTIIDLGGLDGTGVADLLGSVLDSPPTTQLVEAVTTHTGGNPFFVGEMARLMRSTGRVDEEGSWKGILPDGVRSVLVRRLARLPQSCDSTVGAAAVLGAEFDATVLAALIQIERSTAMERLDPAIEAGLLTSLGDGRFQFAHALVRETALGRLSGVARRDFHRRAASVLTMLLGERSAAEIADHHQNGDDPELARAWSVIAARQAAAASMHADAAAWLERALQSNAPGNVHSAQADLLIEFASAAARAGRNDDASAAYTEAARIARVAGRAETLGRAALGIGTIGGSFEIRLLDTGHQALLHEALDRMDPSDSALRSWLLARLSVASSLGPNTDNRQSLADEAVAMARSIDDDAALAHALAAYCDSRAGPAFHEVRQAAADEMLGAAVRSGDSELELLARRFEIIALMEVGNVPLASRHIDEFVRLADRLRQPQFRWYARLMQGMQAHLRGDLDAAQLLCDRASEDGRAAGSANSQMVVDGGLAFVLLRERGEIERCRQIYQEAIVSHHEANRGFDATSLILIDFDPDPEDVRRALDNIPPDGLVNENDSIFLLVTTLEAHAAAYVGDRARALSVAARVEPYADMFVLDGFGSVCYGPVSLFLGKTAALLGDTDAARSSFNRALASVNPLGAPLLERNLRARIDALGSSTAAVGPPAFRRVGPALFRRDGEVWQVSFSSQQARFTDAKGLRDLAALLARPGREIHVLDLVGTDPGSPTHRTTSLGPVLDHAARQAFEAKVRDLTEDIEEAEANNDSARAERLDDERAEILGELSRALGLGGRDRAAGPDPSERARKAVGMRIRGAIDKIDRELPDLGRHLRHSVRTGIYCSYAPEQPVEWSL